MLVVDAHMHLTAERGWRPEVYYERFARVWGRIRVPESRDDPTYLDWTLMVMRRHRAGFAWLAKTPKDFLEPSGGWIETRYGAKSRREGRRPYYLRYRRG